MYQKPSILPLMLVFDRVLPYQSVLNGKQCGLVCVPATQAMALPSLSLVLVLSPTGELCVYSGSLKVNSLMHPHLHG